MAIIFLRAPPSIKRENVANEFRNNPDRLHLRSLLAHQGHSARLSPYERRGIWRTHDLAGVYDCATYLSHRPGKG